MKSSSPKSSKSAARTNAGPHVSTVGGWTLREFAEVNSTNLVAANLPAWSAVRAETQTAGRGRFQRSWISDAGGLWLSAVVPIQPNTPEARALPLAVGLAVCEALRSLGVQDLRMRWPNDVLVGNRKLAGLLIDQFAPELAVAGMGVNVRNEPEARDASLANQTARLADLLPDPPSLASLAKLLLRRLRHAVTEMQAGTFQALLPRVNELWGQPRQVALDLDGGIRRGIFSGVDGEGRLILTDDAGTTTAFAPWQVRHLQEIAN